MIRLARLRPCLTWSEGCAGWHNPPLARVPVTGGEAGPSEFGISAEASLAHWDRTAELASIEMPALVIGARHDTVDPGHMEMMAGRLPRGRYLCCPDGSHLAMSTTRRVLRRPHRLPAQPPGQVTSGCTYATPRAWPPSSCGRRRPPRAWPPATALTRYGRRARPSPGRGPWPARSPARPSRPRPLPPQPPPPGWGPGAQQAYQHRPSDISRLLRYWHLRAEPLLPDVKVVYDRCPRGAQGAQHAKPV